MSKDRRDVVASNFAHVLGKNAPPELLSRVVDDAYSFYGRYWAQVAILRKKHRAQALGNWEIIDRHYLDQALEDGRGVILALPHMGAWEVAAAYLAREGIFMSAVAEVLDPPELFDWFVKRRADLGLTVVPLGGGSASILLQRLRGGGTVALLCDRDVTGDGISVEFFGETTRVPAGPAVLALRSGAALLPCAVYSEAHNHNVAVLRKPLDTSRQGSFREDVSRVTGALIAELEGLIEQAPAQWHAFQANWPGENGNESAPSEKKS
jgi:KDO2-lipid IV(A) lauroyltransferase